MTVSAPNFAFADLFGEFSPALIHCKLSYVSSFIAKMIKLQNYWVCLTAVNAGMAE